MSFGGNGNFIWPIVCPAPPFTPNWTVPLVLENCQFDCYTIITLPNGDPANTWFPEFYRCASPPILTVILTWTPPIPVWQNPSELKMLSAMISSIAYGIVLYLYVVCLQALSEHSTKYSKQKRWFLLGYITVMLLLSTTSILEDILICMADIFNLAPYFPRFWFSLNNNDLEVLPPLSVFPFSIWAADGFMMWRCAVLYRGISKFSRRLLLGILSSLFIVSLAFGSMTFAFFQINPNITSFYYGGPLGPQWILVLMAVSASFNATLSTLIVLRIRYHQSYIQKALGTAHRTLYNRVIIICVESCALIATFEVVYLILFFQNILGGVASWYPSYLLPHICVISPLLMVYRVASGTEATTTVNVSEVVDGEINRLEREIHFRTLVSTRNSHEA
ncbi:hypothetical protein GALMADRAFT_146628 [Galerina marginata CBS 339.88]|uniref:Uncharacterized protein n=1 Tax=Galerina marginata (strain CBS 339.88) TaxID=685588 RepID=A0A067SK98_GALM3|nr:hypothetical protein GALMADRAFT_146628 [Galerina marginata CBS 339.88]